MRARLGAVVVLSIAALAAGCSSGDGAPGGSGGSAGHDGGGGGTAGSAGATSGSCQGDATKWASITQGPFACTKNSDCCVVVNGCVNQAQVVSKQDYDNGAANQWPYCDKDCTACIAPAVDVVCSGGQCGLVQRDPLDASPGQSTSRCGVDTTPVVGTLHPLLGCL